MSKITAIYPGTFDPLTYGHIDIIERASPLFDKLIVAAAVNSSKTTLLNIEERLEIINVSIKDYNNCNAESFEGLLTDFAVKQNAGCIIRGLRTVSDFEYEYQMALMNRKILPDIVTLFLMPSEKFSYISSTLVREIAKFGGDVKEFIPPLAQKLVKAKFR